MKSHLETAAVNIRFVAGAGAFLALTGVTIFLLFSARPRGHWSDAASIRKPSALEQLLTEPTNAAPRLKPDILGDLKLEEDEGSLVVKVQRSEQPSGANIFDATVHALQPGKPIPIGAGQASLDFVAVAYGPPPENLKLDYSVQVPCLYFDGNLEPMSEAEIEKRFGKWQRKRSFHGRFPEVRFAVRFEGIPDIHVLGGRVLDARTGSSLCSGYSHGLDGPSAYLEAAVELWHQSPVWAVLDVAHGPVETEDVVPENGMEIPHAWGLMRLAAIRSGEETGFSSSNDGKVSEVRVRFKTDSDKPETTFVFVGYPGANPIPVVFEFLGDNGQVLPGGGGGSSGGVKIQTVRADRDAIRKMRIKRFPHVRRLVLQLPEVPGLPESNRGVKNLFEVKVPHLWLRETWEMRQFVERSLQLDWAGYNPGTPPPGYFPRAYTNATLRDVFRDCLTLQPGNLQVRIDPERHRIEVVPPFWMRWFERIRQVLHL